MSDVREVLALALEPAAPPTRRRSRPEAESGLPPEPARPSRGFYPRAGASPGRSPLHGDAVTDEGARIHLADYAGGGPRPQRFSGKIIDALRWWRLGRIARGAGGKAHMPGQIPTGDIHHLRLTVTDLERSRQFYTSLLGFQVAVE